MKVGGLLLLALVIPCGCSRFFSAKGVVGSDGAGFGQWASTPEGCSRAPIDLPRNEAMEGAKSRTIASFIWEDPVDYDPSRADWAGLTAPDRPLEFTLLRGATGPEVRLQTVHVPGWLIRREDCTRFELNTYEQPAPFAGGRPALAGTLHLECRVKASRVWADLTFQRCEY